ncbi:hypothetical protein L541_0030 [Bordetella hinzii CA90 BAL1384]|uniref:Uncharacterized protein n=1 Tax=Bordetella hinzii OH87 BAL007II TaxID=1331262 RepID=A0ABR4QUL5_9BORD|nr:hypothetical protein L544_0010 [Bordetella hinzii OH87 BAL007II]KCB29094.1 hypothetical protein L541_0030 [Bordetella hinzii CA90 BAL1384]KCB43079.1 hypothetical protein L539_0010 [Bordetella hinzii 5132]
MPAVFFCGRRSIEKASPRGWLFLLACRMRGQRACLARL